VGKAKETKASERPPPGRNGFRYRARFGVIVICDDEDHQERVYAALKEAGYTCRVVVV